MRKVAHFAGYHGKASALVAGTGRFYGGIEGEDVGLEGDVVDHRNDIHDLARRFVDVVHGGDDLTDHFNAFTGYVGSADGKLVGLFGVFGIMLHGGGQLFHAGGGLFQTGGLLFGAVRQVIVAGGNFFGSGVDAVGEPL